MVKKKEQQLNSSETVSNSFSSAQPHIISSSSLSLSSSASLQQNESLFIGL
jgi:hypothetical protein